MSPKAEETEHIEFIKEIRFRAYYDINYSYLKSRYTEIRKVISLSTQIKILNFKIFIYKRWINFSKFCYKIGVENAR